MTPANTKSANAPCGCPVRSPKASLNRNAANSAEPAAANISPAAKQASNLFGGDSRSGFRRCSSMQDAQNGTDAAAMRNSVGESEPEYDTMKGLRTDRECDAEAPQFAQSGGYSSCAISPASSILCACAASPVAPA